MMVLCAYFSFAYIFFVFPRLVLLFSRTELIVVVTLLQSVFICLTISADEQFPIRNRNSCVLARLQCN